MKNILHVMLFAALLSGCAARDENGEIIHNPDGSEQISFWRTTGLVVGIPLVILGAAAMAKNSGGSSDFSNYAGSCECPNDTASDGSLCGKRSAFYRTGGATPSAYSCHLKEASYSNKQYTY